MYLNVEDWAKETRVAFRKPVEKAFTAPNSNDSFPTTEPVVANSGDIGERNRCERGANPCFDQAALKNEDFKTKSKPRQEAREDQSQASRNVAEKE